MASLGWLLNLGFAGGTAAGAAAGPAVGSLLLLGVGRAWWLPFVWPLLTGRAYAGEADTVVESIWPWATFVAGGLLTYAVIAYRDYIRRKRRRALAAELERARFTVDRSPKIASTVEGSAKPAVCLNCGKSVSTFHLLTDGTVRCKGCC